MLKRILILAALIASPALADPLSPVAQQGLTASVAAQIGALALDNATLKAQLGDAQRQHEADGATIADLQKQLAAAKAPSNAGGAAKPAP